VSRWTPEGGSTADSADQDSQAGPVQALRRSPAPAARGRGGLQTNESRSASAAGRGRRGIDQGSGRAGHRHDRAKRSGKPTTFNACTGLVTPTQEASLDRRVEVLGRGPAARARLGSDARSKKMELFRDSDGARESRGGGPGRARRLQTSSRTSQASRAGSARSRAGQRAMGAVRVNRSADTRRALSTGRAAGRAGPRSRSSGCLLLDEALVGTLTGPRPPRVR